MSFFGELKRRSVTRVAVLYGVASWLILQIADVLFPNLGAPDWAFGLVLGLLLLFFIPVLIFAWVYEMTPEGLRKEKERDPDRPIDNQTGTKTNTVTIVLLLLVIGLVILDRMNPQTTPAIVEQEVVEVVEQAPPQNLSSPEPSIAVLPFETRSDDKQDEYFSAGIHDDLLTQLAKIHGLKVISRTSVMQYANTIKPMREIADELQVATVLEGGVQRAGDRIRVNVQLIDAHTDKHLWAETYDEELTVANIFSIQSRLATSIAGALQTELSPAVQVRIADQPTDNLETWHLTSRADFLLEQEQTQQNLEDAVDLYRQAIDEDPEYAAAWAGLSLAIHELVAWYYWPDSSLDEAWRSALKAIALDPDLAEGHFARGDLLRIERRYAKGEQAFQRGLELSPGSADGYSRYGDILRDAGRFEESVLQSRKGVELDPHMIRTRVALLQNLYFSRAWDTVIEEAKKTLQMENDTAEAWYWLALASAWKGEHDASVEAAEKAIAIDPDTPFTHSGLAYIHSMAGRDEEALAMLKNAENQNWPHAEVGLVYAWLGDLDEAFAHMDRAFEERPSGLHYIAADPAADPMRSDPRWAEFLERLEPE
jgi:TolB-like protein/Tfp pilus assembly protein PilF